MARARPSDSLVSRKHRSTAPARSRATPHNADATISIARNSFAYSCWRFARSLTFCVRAVLTVAELCSNATLACVASAASFSAAKVSALSKDNAASAARFFVTSTSAFSFFFVSVKVSATTRASRAASA